MLEKALELLKIFKDNEYQAFIVGGFVRDYVLERSSCDIDICTNATPMEVKEIFKDVKLPFEGYGSVHLTYKKVNFEITTFRMDLEYINGRAPSKIMYTDNLIIDLKRRDFTINTMCMDHNGKIYDLLNAKEDLQKKVIRSVKNPDVKLKEDSLRILRAIRFATELNFTIEDELKKAIIANKHLLDNLSFFRKKQELNKIFSSVNALYGIGLLKEFGLDKYLGIDLSNDIVKTNDPIGIWAQINPDSKYQFTSNEKSFIKAILRLVEEKEITDIELYREGNYVCSIAAKILGLDDVEIHNRLDNLPIKNMTDINMKQIEVIEVLNLEDKSNVKKIMRDLEEKIITNKLNNNYEEIKKYLIDTYN